MIMSQEPSVSVDELLARWVAGDAQAGHALYRRYYTRAWRFALKITGRESEADELAQHALASGLEGLQQGRRPDRLTRWILGIVHHGALRGWTRERRDKEARPRLPAAAGRSPHTQAVRAEMARLLEEALARLSEEDRRLLELRVERALRRPEAAERLGLPPATMDRRLAKVFATLREALSRHFTTLVLPRALAAPRRTVGLKEIERLRPSFRRVVELCHLEGRSVEEAARTLAVPAETVRLRLQYAHETLKCSAEDDFEAARAEYLARRAP